MKQKIPSSPSELVKSLPKELKNILFSQWKAKQSPKWHPEGNTLKHILVVLKRVYHHFPGDTNLILASLFHDLGKIETYKVNPKTNEPTAHGHENVSTEYVEKFADWINIFEDANIDEIKYLVKNHMKVKPQVWDVMKEPKKEKISSNPAFEKLMSFTNKLDGGGTHLKESKNKKVIRLDGNLKEEILRVKQILFTINEVFENGQEPSLTNKIKNKEKITYQYSLPSKKSEGQYFILVEIFKNYENNLKNVMEIHFKYEKKFEFGQQGYTGLNEIFYLFDSINKLIIKHKKEFNYLFIYSSDDRLSLFEKALSRVSFLDLIDKKNKHLVYKNIDFKKWF